jgi:serine/threonine protein kinase/membrane protein implicated in regulation of membrane protease activity
MDETIEIPGYKIERHLGSGATATVYLAEQINLRRKVAIKLMTTGLVTESSFRERFMQEGRVVAQLNHPNIVTVFDINEYNSNYYMVMEYVDGGMTLRERIQEGLEVDEAITIASQIGAALDYAHKRNFVHRDVKPANILFRADGAAVLSDFGIARVVGGGSQLTQQGYTVGTPAYMSPEQVMGQDIGIRSDLYSLGVVFYEMLTGKAPFQAQETFALAMKHVNDRPPLLPRDLEAYQAVLDKAMAKKPEDRYVSAEAMVKAIKQAHTGTAVTADITVLAPKTTGVTKVIDTPAQASALPAAALPAAPPLPSPEQERDTRRQTSVWIWTLATVLSLFLIVWLLVMLDLRSTPSPPKSNIEILFQQLSMRGELHWYWWIAGLIFMVLEIILPGIFFLWLGVAAFVVGAILVLFSKISWQTQFLLFGLLSIAATIVWHALWHNEQSKSDQPVLNRRGHQCVGRVVTLQQPIVDGWGKVLIDGLSWKARGEDLPSGTKIRVVDVDGATLIVEPANRQASNRRS